jgi:hypothetical protein
VGLFGKEIVEENQRKDSEMRGEVLSCIGLTNKKPLENVVQGVWKEPDAESGD